MAWQLGQSQASGSDSRLSSNLLCVSKTAQG